MLVAQMGHLAATGTKVWKDMAPRAVEWLETPLDTTMLEAPRALTDQAPLASSVIQKAEGPAAIEDRLGPEEDEEQEDEGPDDKLEDQGGDIE